MTTIEKVRRRVKLGGDLHAIGKADVQFLEEELQNLVGRIAGVQSFLECEDLLKRLGELQETLAILWFKYDVAITPQQKELVRKFDRSDDPTLCLHVFQEIKEGRFLKL